MFALRQTEKGESLPAPLSLNSRQELKKRPFQLGAISAFLALLAPHEINKFRVFNTREYSDSPASTILLLNINGVF